MLFLFKCLKDFVSNSLNSSRLVISEQYYETNTYFLCKRATQFILRLSVIFHTDTSGLREIVTEILHYTITTQGFSKLIH